MKGYGSWIVSAGRQGQSGRAALRRRPLAPRPLASEQQHHDDDDEKNADRAAANPDAAEGNHR